eukprot:410271-Pelagomonas_calceolata.AAC.4
MAKFPLLAVASRCFEPCSPRATEALRRAESGKQVMRMDVNVPLRRCGVLNATEALRRAESGSVTDGVRAATMRGAMRLQRKGRGGYVLAVEGGEGDTEDMLDL